MSNETTARKIDNLANSIGHLLNEDIRTSVDFDPIDHVTALSMVLTHAAQQLGMNKENFLSGVGQIYDTVKDMIVEDREEKLQ